MTTAIVPPSTLLALSYQSTGAELSITPEALQQKENAIAALAQITEVSDPNQLAIASNLISIAAGLERKIEDTRKTVKAPVLDLGKLIDTTAKDYIGPVTVAKDRVLALVTEFNKKEAAHVAEVNRLAAEEERKRLAALEEARKKEEAAAAERERLRLEELRENTRKAEEAAELARKAAAPTEGEDPALAAMRQAAAEEELAEIERNRVAQEQQIKDEQEAQRLQEEAKRLQEESDRTKVTTSTLAAAPPKVRGMSAQKVWKYSVENPLEFYKAHPELCKIELVPSLINQAIKDGLRESPGITIFQEDVTRVRAAV